MNNNYQSIEEQKLISPKATVIVQLFLLLLDLIIAKTGLGSVLFWSLPYSPLVLRVIGFPKLINGSIVLDITFLDLRQSRLGKCNTRFKVLGNGQHCTV